jgi:hypothetical protein
VSPGLAALDRGLWWVAAFSHYARMGPLTSGRPEGSLRCAPSCVGGVTIGDTQSHPDVLRVHVTGARKGNGVISVYRRGLRATLRFRVLVIAVVPSLVL